jgi:hypothetical protein
MKPYKKSKIKQFFLYFSFLFIVQLSVTQTGKTQILIYGQIVDNDTKKPLEHVTVSDSTSKLFSISDEKGYYKLIIPKQTTFLKFSYIGCKTFVKAVVPETKQKLLEMNIALQKAHVELPVVEITTKNFIPVYTKKEDWVIDYAFIGDSLILMINEFGEKFIKIIDQEGTVLYEKKTELNVNEFFKDCLGNIHLLGQDSVYQIYFADNELLFLKPFTIKDFEQQLEPCITSCENNMFFSSYYNHHQSLIYFAINKNNKKKIYLEKISNAESISYIEKYLKEMPKGSINTSNENVASGMGDDPTLDREIEEDYDYVAQILSKPIYSPLFNINDSIFIFDHIKKQVNVFTGEGKKIREFPVSYVDNNQWANELIVDNEKNSVYTKYLKDGGVKLIRINLITGVAEQTYSIYHVFPLKIKIHGDYIYYLYKNEFSDSEKRFLFKQKID